MSRLLAPASGTRLRRVLAALAFAALAATVVWKAWLAEDAYISFRMLDNLVNGYGLRWNVTERVDAMTHPLWIFLNAPLYLVWRNVFFATFFTGAALVLATWALLLRSWREDADVLFAMVLFPLLLTKTYTDFLISGLETPLIVFVIGAFFLVMTAEGGAPAPVRLRRLVLIASAGALTRPDLPVLFVFPILAFAVSERVPVGRAFLAAAAGVLPLLAWGLFCFIYFGFPLPNTYYMRLATGIPARDYLAQGRFYFADLIDRDPLSALGIAAALLAFVPLAVSAARRRGGSRDLFLASWALGIALLLASVLRVGGDFMAGRFFLAPLVASALLLGALARRLVVRAPAERRALLLGSGALAIAALGVLLPSAGPGSAVGNFHGIADEKLGYSATNDLVGLSRTNGPSRHEWSRRGLALREAAARSGQAVTYGTAMNVGMLGYYAGPRVVIVDQLGHTDAFVARLPVVGRWRIGHFRRVLPAGYSEAVMSGSTAGLEPRLKELYEKLRYVISGPVFSWDRMKVALELNRRSYQPELEAWRREIAAHGPPRGGAELPWLDR